MKTYQDLIKVGEKEQDRMDFLVALINEYKASEFCRVAEEAELYARQLNPTIMRYQKLLYTITGQTVPDNFSANHKCASNFFYRAILQENQYLLGNGVTFQEESTKESLGGMDFDRKVQEAGLCALCGGVAYGFFNVDHITVFKAQEFVPLWDEEDGTLKAGVRFWQIDVTKPLLFTLYEMDGYTEYIRKKGDNVSVKTPKQSYKAITKQTEAKGVEVVAYENYNGFPIVPLWANLFHQSELVGMKGQIDAYDLIKSGFANDLDDASMFYWTLENCGGMDDIDLVKFVERMKTIKASFVSNEVDGARAESHTMEIPYESRQVYLKMLEEDIHKDFMALNVENIQSGNTTATQIEAMYEPLNEKVDQFEYLVIDFILAILELAGIKDYPTFNRSKITNQQEETEMVLSSASVLDDETIIRHLPFLSSDEVNDVIARAEYEGIDKLRNTLPEEEE